MDKQLTSPLLIEPVGRATKLSPQATFTSLQSFLGTLQPSPARTQLERLADALGVETGAIAPSEEARREAERVAARAKARAERRAEREAARKAAEEAELEAAVEDEGDNEAAHERFVEAEDEAEEEGLGQANFDDVEGMEDRGDVEYGDVPESDHDEPDNEVDMDE
ncbi:uncharacterized protein LOC62_02G003021 [Vanrija pseudolonga]|uniref:Uncharacterized protein n=1 Tax=Vanrija pseudolonga TaxID=143232 RepID=A0AAF1BPJ6_9TREE|nr:hypothetical protein LOC62_02G003021 [Vanrija pseudolonga]